MNSTTKQARDETAKRGGREREGERQTLHDGLAGNRDT